MKATTPLLAIIFVLSGSMIIGQETKPTCNRCSATYVPKSEIDAYLARIPKETRVADQQVRAVDVGKTNVDIGVVYRGKLSGPPQVAEHDLVSEVYHVLDGEATLVTSWDIVDAKRRPADDQAVRLLNGPGSNGTDVRNGVTHQLKAGDVLIVPAGVGHWFTKIDDHIRYLMIRVDPDKVTPGKDEAASKKDLASTAPDFAGRR